ncbi:MAG TPA: PIN domain-containing protein [Terracidiphilus sp.]|nr:PIN domain-containing protein [Terracidiphilus sp.]
MPLILDSSVIIPEERKGKNAHRAISEIAEASGNQDLAISVITVVELAHGIARSNSLQREQVRRQFLDELVAAIPVLPITIPIALRAGRMDGENTARGVRIALADLLIGANALEVGYSVATVNVRHFQLIPGLSIVRF